MLVRVHGILSLLLSFMMSQPAGQSQCTVSTAELVATRLSREIVLNAKQPDPAWNRAQPRSFCADWQGNNPEPERQTSVRVLWSATTLYVRFECRYHSLTVFSDSEPSGRRDQLWDRDVAEIFLQPDPSRSGYYKEFEISPNGMWIDLDIFPGGRSDLKSGMQRSVWLDELGHTWAAELAIPIESLTKNFDPKRNWRVNCYRVEGVQEPRAYLAWQPTRTPQPNFHVPAAFGALRFEP